MDILNKIAAALEIVPSIIYDDYLDFVSSDYGSKIKTIRKNLKLTQKEFGNLLGVHEKTIRMWEKQLSYPTRENFEKLLKTK